jgi:hypothetical protein
VLSSERRKVFYQHFHAPLFKKLCCHSPFQMILKAEETEVG